MKKVLFTATVVKKHIMQFHIPYLKMLKEMGFETYVAARNDYDNPSDCVIPYCDHFIDIPFERNPIKPDNIKAYQQLKKLVETEHFSLIHTHTPVGAFLTRLAARKARKEGTQVIYTAHGFHFFDGAPLVNWLIYYPAERFASRFTDVLITINREDYKRALGFHAGKVCYIPGVGIDMDRFNSEDNDPEFIRKQYNFSAEDHILLSVGELNTNKNHILVIDAMACMNDPSVKYIVCGEGPELDALMHKVKELSLDSQVYFTGYTKEVGKYYASADLFVFPSFREGLSLSLMEAISSKLPVLCSDIRGNKDLVRNGKYRFSPKNKAEFLEKLMNAIHSDNSEEVRNNLDHLKHFEISNVLSQVQEIYSECLKEKA